MAASDNEVVGPKCRGFKQSTARRASARPHKPYAHHSHTTQRHLWECVHRDVWGPDGHGTFHVVEQFEKMLDKYERGAFKEEARDTTPFKLLEKLTEDVQRCDKVGYARVRPEEQVGRPATGRCDEKQQGDQDREAWQVQPPTHQWKDKQKASAKPTVEVDAVSVEQFVDLLDLHAPHLAKTSKEARAAWARLGDALPPGNALCGESTRVLKTCFSQLKDAVASRSRDADVSLAKSAVKKLLSYCVRLETPPATDTDEDDPDTRGDDDAAGAKRRRAAPDALADAGRTKPPKRHRRRRSGRADAAVDAQVAITPLPGLPSNQLSRRRRYKRQPRVMKNHCKPTTMRWSRVSTTTSAATYGN